MIYFYCAKPQVVNLHVARIFKARIPLMMEPTGHSYYDSLSFVTMTSQLRLRVQTAFGRCELYTPTVEKGPWKITALKDYTPFSPFHTHS